MEARWCPTDYSWTGNQNANWTDQRNWSGNGNPNVGYPDDTNDKAIIASVAAGKSNPVLDANQTIGWLVLDNGGNLDVNGKDLQLNQAGNYVFYMFGTAGGAGGTINFRGGRVEVASTGTSNWEAGTLTDSARSATSGLYMWGSSGVLLVQTSAASSGANFHVGYKIDGTMASTGGTMKLAGMSGNLTLNDGALIKVAYNSSLLLHQPVAGSDLTKGGIVQGGTGGSTITVSGGTLERNCLPIVNNNNDNGVLVGVPVVVTTDGSSHAGTLAVRSRSTLHVVTTTTGGVAATVDGLSYLDLYDDTKLVAKTGSATDWGVKVTGGSILRMKATTTSNVAATVQARVLLDNGGIVGYHALNYTSSTAGYTTLEIAGELKLDNGYISVAIANGDSFTCDTVKVVAPPAGQPGSGEITIANTCSVNIYCYQMGSAPASGKRNFLFGEKAAGSQAFSVYTYVGPSVGSKTWSTDCTPATPDAWWINLST